MIRVKDLTKKYGNIDALKGITIEINDKVTSIIGRNGAGKTTFIRILSTQLKPTSGSVNINGMDIDRDINKIRKIILSIPQEAQPVGIMTPLEHLELYLIARGYSLSEARREGRYALEELEMEEFKDVPCDELSGGMKRKVFVAMALASKVDIVFLDEPTTGLDPLSRMEVWNSIRKLDSNIILTTHYMEEASELSNKVIVFNEGQVVSQGTVRDLLAPFKNKVRVEKTNGEEYDVKIGKLSIKYVPNERAQEYLSKGYDVKNITLDDLFISRGVTLES